MALSITNWDFSDFTGLTVRDASWYDWTPNGWTSSGGTWFYSVNTAEWLNLANVETVSQWMGTVESGGEVVTVYFDYADKVNTARYVANEDMMTVEIWDTTTATQLATKTVKNIAPHTVDTSDSISITATAWNNVEVRFTGLPWSWSPSGTKATVIDNITVLGEWIPTPRREGRSSDFFDFL